MVLVGDETVSEAEASTLGGAAEAEEERLVADAGTEAGFFLEDAR